jgi:hypothetical protein
MFDMKENVQIVFVNAYENHPHLFLLTDTKLVGLVYYHGTYTMPPVGSSHDWTPLLDISYTFDIVQQDLQYFASQPPALSPNTPCPVLKVSEREMKEMQWLFEQCRKNSVNIAPHSKVEKLNRKTRFKRCILYPLYPAAGLEQGFQVKSLQKDREKLKSTNDILQKTTEIVRNMAQNIPPQQLAQMLKSLNLK